jgi:tetratricopeptide (TPR) repeat protein
MARPRNEPTAPFLRHVLIPLSVVIAGVLHYRVGLPLAVVVLAALPLTLLYVYAPRWAARSQDAFDRDALRLRAKGNVAGVRARFDRAIGMRLFAPPASVLERRGQILRESGDPEGARRAFARAVFAAGDAPPLPMVLGLAHSAHAAKQDDEAIGAYRRVLAIDPSLPRVRLQLAHALLRRGRETDVPDALALLDAVPNARTDTDELALLRAYADVRRGKTKTAGIALGAIPGGAHPALRAEIEAARASRRAARKSAVSRRRASAR